LSISGNVDLISHSVEALVVSVTHDAITIRLIVMCRPPKAPKGTDFFYLFWGLQHLVQHVSEPTHRDGHILDLAVTRQNDNIVHMASVYSIISDHMAIHIHLNVSKQTRPTRNIRAIYQNCLADDN